MCMIERLSVNVFVSVCVCVKDRLLIRCVCMFEGVLKRLSVCLFVKDCVKDCLCLFLKDGLFVFYVCLCV